MSLHVDLLQMQDDTHDLRVNESVRLLNINYVALPKHEQEICEQEYKRICSQAIEKIKKDIVRVKTSGNRSYKLKYGVTIDDDCNEQYVLNYGCCKRYIRNNKKKIGFQCTSFGSNTAAFATGPVSVVKTNFNTGDSQSIYAKLDVLTDELERPLKTTVVLRTPTLSFPAQRHVPDYIKKYLYDYLFAIYIYVMTQLRCLYVNDMDVESCNIMHQFINSNFQHVDVTFFEELPVLYVEKNTLPIKIRSDNYTFDVWHALSVKPSVQLDDLFNMRLNELSSDTSMDSCTDSSSCDEHSELNNE